MAFDIAVTEETFAGNEDRRWAAHRKGFDTCKSGTLDVSTFNANHFTEKGAIPSGTALGLITATGKYGPYDNSGITDEVQKITLDADGGTYAIVVDGEQTAEIAWNANTAATQAAIDALSNVDSGDLTAVVAGSVVTLTFGGKWAGTNVPAVTTDVTNLDKGQGAGTATVTTDTPGSESSVTDGRAVFAGLLFNTTKVGRAGDGSDFATAADVVVPVMREGIINQDYLPVFAGTSAGEVDADARESAVGGQFIWEGTDL